MADPPVEQYIPRAPEIVWPVLVEAIEAEKNLTPVATDAGLMRVEFKTKVGVVQRGPDFTATVQPSEGGSLLRLHGVSRYSAVTTDKNIKKIADAVIKRVGASLPPG